MRRVCVFCGSSAGRDPRYSEAAQELAREMIRRRLGLVFGGGSVGLMGVLADAILAAGGEAIGVIPGPLAAREVAHTGLTDLRVVPTMHARKAMMADLADGFVALPGGFGTLEELLEITTWAQLGIHRKPIGVLNVAGYFDPLVMFLDGAVAQGFVPEASRALLVVGGVAGDLLDRMARYRGPAVREWVRPEEA